MAKKYKSHKLLKQTIQAQQTHTSAFGKHANKLADAKKKKIQKLSETQKRMLESKKNNKMIKISKKAKKFALLDQDDQNGQFNTGKSLTHRGVNIKDIKQFDDVNFNQSDLQNDEQFQQIQDKMNFAGFQATDNLYDQPKRQGDDRRQKTKNEIYKQIIQKSKAYKMVRQQIYEQNLNKANELDDEFNEFKTQLKFRNKDQKIHQQLQNRDLEYDKLMNELREDDRVVSNKIVQKNEKYTQKIRKRKNEQLNKIMKDSDGQEGDIRGWVDEADESSQQQGQGEYDDEEGQQELQGQEQQGQGQQQQQEEQGSYDELDDVDLSSEEEQGQGQEQNEGEEQGEELQSGEGQELQNDEDVQGDGDQQQQQQEEGDSGSEQQQEDQSQEEEVVRGNKYQNKNKNKNKQADNKADVKPSNSSKNQTQLISNKSQKKRKLNFVS